MDEFDICPGESLDAIEETNDTDNPNKSNDLSVVHTDCCQTSEQFSQELFNDNETNSTTQNSPASVIFRELSEIRSSSSSQLDLLVTPIQTLKIFKEDRSPNQAIVPTVPISLVPFISTVNESWTSDLETPNAETVAFNKLTGNLHNGESDERLRLRESLRRNRCNSIKSNADLADATTPNGCFVSRIDDGGFSTSPILHTSNKRHRPKRRILKSLDNNTSNDCLMDLTNVVESSAKLEEIVDSETRNRCRSDDPMNDNFLAGNYETILTDTNSSLCNSNIQAARDEASSLFQKVDKLGTGDPFVVDSPLYATSIVEPRQYVMETISTNVSNQCDDKIDERLNEVKKKFLGDRLREMKKLQKNRPRLGEDKYIRIPNEFFVKEAEILESAEMSPIISNVKKKCQKSDAKSQWGLMSFTQMCSLEEKNDKIEPSSHAVNNLNNEREIRVVKIAKTEPAIKEIEKSENVEKNDLPKRNESSAIFFLEEDERDIADIFASSFLDKEETVIDVDEFSPWFYQSDETKSDSSKYVKIAANSSSETSHGKAKGESKTTMREEECRSSNEDDKLNDCSSRLTAINHKPFTASTGGVKKNNCRQKRNEGSISEITSYSSVDFSTASGRPIKISEDKMRQAKKLYDEIAAQDGDNCDDKFLDVIAERKNHQRNEKSNENIGQATISDNFHNTAGFCTAGGKPIAINEEKLKQAEKLFAVVSAEVGDNLSENLSPASDSPGVVAARGIKRKQESHQTVNSVAEFITAHGQPLNVSETAMKKAKLMFDDEDILFREIEQSKKFMSSKNVSKVTQLAADSGCVNTKPENVSSGFTTAGGKSLSISKSALEKAERLYENLSDVPNAKDKVSATSFEHSNKEIITNTGDHALDTGERNTAVRDEGSKAFVQNMNLVEKRESWIGQSLTGFSTASGFAIRVSDEAISKAKILLAEEKFDCDLNSPSSTTCGENRFAGSSRATDKRMEMSDQALSNAKISLAETKIGDKSDHLKRKTENNEEEILLFSETDDQEMNKKISTSSAFVKENKCSAAEQESTPSINSMLKRNVRDGALKVFVRNVNSVGKCESSVGQTLTGFSTAGGTAIRVSDEAISKAKMLLAEEGVDCDLNSPSNLTSGENRFLGVRKASEKGNKWLAVEQENTPPSNSSTKRNISQAIRTSTKRNVSVFTTPGFGSPSENAHLKSENAGSVFQRSKKIRLSYDLQARKLFNDKGNCDTDEEAENVGKFDNEKTEIRQTNLLYGSNDRALQILSHEQQESVSFVHSNGFVMYANSEMFQTTDRLAVPKLKPQKSSPLIVQNDDRDARLTKTHYKEQLASLFDEVTASTEALLADEENSNDAKSWPSAITCSPSMTEEREIPVRPITLGENGDAIQEVPTSPIIGDKFRSRKKKRRSKRSSLMKSALKSETNDRLNRKEAIDEQIGAPCSQPSDATTSTSGSFKELHRNNSPAVGCALISNLHEHGESSKNYGRHESHTSEQISSEIYCQQTIVDVLENRIAATLKQEKIIRAKKKLKLKPAPGSLYLCKMNRKESRLSLRDLTNGIPPAARTPQELIDLGVGIDVMKISAANAAQYRLKCAHFHSLNGEEICADACQLDVGDGGSLILDEIGFAGAREFERAFIASPNVDPNLVPQGWIENHYRWIVWKLASMDRMKLGRNRMLTPDNIMKQLKYRYDREIDRSQRPALRKIIEKDDPACRRIVLCVATLAKIPNDQSPESKIPKIGTTSRWKVELTDGWYSIAASVDAAMEHLISSGKVREGTKLVTCGGELLNCDQGCSPLEIPADVSLKIHCNSTRRVKWDTKLGYCRNAGPIPTKLTAVLPYGGLIGKLDTIVARVYPIQYFEKTPTGQAIFRNDKCEDKAATIYEEKRQAQIDAIYSKARADFESRSWKDSKTSGSSSIESFRNEVESILKKDLPPPRKVTPVLKVRVIEGENIASLTVWAPSEDIVDILKEGNRVSVHSLQSSGLRSGELNLTAGRQSFVKYEETAHDFPRRRLTEIKQVAVTGFNPIFGDLDTVGVIVSLGPAPHGMKNFEVVNLASPNIDSSSSAYLSILFWEGIAAYGYSEILTVGSTVACANLQWRRGLPRRIPTVYSTEHSTFTRNPRQAHLRSAFDHINGRITDLPGYTAKCAAEIANENENKPTVVRSPAIRGSPNKTSPMSSVSLNERSTTGADVNQRTPQGAGMNTGEIITPAKYSIQRRLEKLQWYGDPPDLSPVTLLHSSVKVKQKFVSPLRTPEKRN